MSGPHALLWSGGKDCALALGRARAAGLQITVLLNFHDPATGRVRFHATGVDLLAAQATALGIELVSLPCAWTEMDIRFREELSRLRRAGYAGVVLGDIHLADVRSWYEERVQGSGMQHVEPIWGEDPASLLREFVESGGRAVLTCVDTARLGAEWLGREIDENFVETIGATGCDPCGENGEYHSFVYDAPGFNRPIGWEPAETYCEGTFLSRLLAPQPTSSATGPS